MAPQTLCVSFVLGEEKFYLWIANERVVTQSLVRRENHATIDLPQKRFMLVFSRCPGVSESQSREDVKPRRLGSSVVNRDSDQHIFGRFFCEFHKHIKVPIVNEDTGVEKLTFELLAERRLFASNKSK